MCRSSVLTAALLLTLAARVAGRDRVALVRHEGELSSLGADAVVVGYFPWEALDQAVEGDEAWEAFEKVAEQLSDVAAFALAGDHTFLSSMGIVPEAMPSLLLLDMASGEDPIWFEGSVRDVSAMRNWVIGHGNPGVEQLRRGSLEADVYASKFFSSRLLKVIAFLPAKASAASKAAVGALETAGEATKGWCLVSFVQGRGYPEINEYFGVGVHEYPMLLLYDPTSDARYLRRVPLEGITAASVEAFARGVLSGAIKPSPKSEATPSAQEGHVTKLVGSTLLGGVAQEGVDVLLEVYAPWCAHCKALAPTYEILGRAFSAEPRVMIAKIDGTANDIPSDFGVKGYPTLLWFRAADKPYGEGVAPRPSSRWDGGLTLHDLAAFVAQQSSFQAEGLRMASPEQLGSLAAEEENLRQAFAEREKWDLRNDGRFQYDSEAMDWLAGEVTFDGTRAHFAAFAFSAALNALLIAAVLLRTAPEGSKGARAAGPAKGGDAATAATAAGDAPQSKGVRRRRG